MPYEVSDVQGYMVVALAGEVDLSHSPDARKTILDCLDRRRHVLVDLSEVTYIDSSGVASLVEGFQSAKKQKLQFGLIAVSPPAMAVLRLARLDRVFEIHATLDERVAARGGTG